MPVFYPNLLLFILLTFKEIYFLSCTKIKDSEKTPVKELSKNQENSGHEVFFTEYLKGGRTSKTKAIGFFIHFIGRFNDFQRLNINDFCFIKSETALYSETDISKQYTYEEILEVKSKCISDE